MLDDDVIEYGVNGWVANERDRRHPRAKNLQVRFREDEYDDLAEYADQCGLPVSTVVRMLVLQAIVPAGDLKAALDRLERDVAAVRRKALSA